MPGCASPNPSTAPAPASFLSPVVAPPTWAQTVAPVYGLSDGGVAASTAMPATMPVGAATWFPTIFVLRVALESWTKARIPPAVGLRIVLPEIVALTAVLASVADPMVSRSTATPMPSLLNSLLPLITLLLIR
jgi:hypothetical protein